jgi:zinc protease
MALVERGLASAVSGSLLPTTEPFLYSVALTASEGVALASLEEAAVAEVERVRANGLTEDEVARAKRQLRARLVFETDSVTNIAHQIGYFETVTGPGYFEALSSRVLAVTPEQVADVAARRLSKDKRTTGWFRPLERKG